MTMVAAVATGVPGAAAGAVPGTLPGSLFRFQARLMGGPRTPIPVAVPAAALSMS